MTTSEGIPRHRCRESSRRPGLGSRTRVKGGLAWALAILICLPIAAAAHFGNIVIPIYELPTSDLPDLHDGTLEDWEEVMPGPSVTDRDFTSSAGVGDVLDQSSLAFRVFLAWHLASQRLYMAVERFDDEHYNRGESDDERYAFYSMLNSSDCVELLVDADHSGGPFFGSGSQWRLYEGESKLVMNVTAQRWVATPEPVDQSVQGGRQLGLYWYLDGGWFTAPPYGDAGGFVLGGALGEPTVSGTELYVTPWDALDVDGPEQSTPGRLSAGRVIGLDVFVWDWDGPEDGDLSAFVLLGTASNVNASGFKDALLQPCYVEDCSGAGGTAVRPSSWGRVKAALREGSP